MENPKIKLTAEITEVIHFALQQNRIPAVREITIQNDGEIPLEEASLLIETNADLSEPYRQTIQHIPARSETALKDIQLSFCSSALANLTERLTESLKLTLWSKEGELLAELTRSLAVLAYDEWHGAGYFPELLAAYVTPNHPEVMKIVARASEILGEWSKNPSLDGYQSRSPNRARQQAAAAYAALQEQQIAYAVPPASFEVTGQRIRLCETIMQQRIGTCLDLTLFYAGCLEAMGLNPLLILKKGHIFAGLWLEDSSFPEAVQDDPSLVTKRIADGTTEMSAVECTAFSAGKNINFEGAEKMAALEFFDGTPVQMIIDLRRARLSRIRPLPLRIQTNTGWNFRAEQQEELSPSAPGQLAQAVKVREVSSVPVTRRALWERKLLDLGLRNTLLNLRPTLSIIPILTSSIGALEDALSSGEEFGILPRPAEWKGLHSSYDLGSFHLLGPYEELIQAEFRSRRLRSALGEGELSRTIVSLYRNSKVSLEENGANTLYLSLGLLRWYESRASEKPLYAPVVLLPVEIIRKTANKGYVIRLRDEEPQINVTLLEMLKQDFGIAVGGLDPLPADENGIDIRTVFSVIRRAVMEQSRWDLLEGAVLGIFSFSQFVMWNDLRTRWDAIQKSPIVKSLLDGKLAWNARSMQDGDAPSEDGVFLPIPADASQLLAIRTAGEGESFVLHGPPGTGKSQTITAIIANALAQNKTVLFVAEKMAALSVVQNRLEQMGLGSFCLELHSNKSRKRDVLDKLRTAAELSRECSGSDYDRQAEQTALLREELDSFARTLHKPQQCGLSLYEIIGRYEANVSAGDAIVFTGADVSGITEEILERQEQTVGRLIAAASALDHPYRHPLRWVGSSQYTQQLRTQLPQILEECTAAGKAAMEARREISLLLEHSFRDIQEDWEWFAQAAKCLSAWKDIPSIWARSPQLDQLFSAAHGLEEHGRKALSARDILMERWKPEFLSQDGAALESDWREVSSKWLFPRIFGQKKMIKHLRAFCLDTMEKEDIPPALSSLADYQIEQLAGLEALRDCGEEIEHLYQGDATDWESLVKRVESISRRAQALEELPGGREIRTRFASSEEAVEMAGRFTEAWERFQDASRRLNNLLELAPPEPEDWMAQQISRWGGIQENMDSLREWMVWKGICKESLHIGLGPVVAAYEGGIFHKEVIPCYRKAVYLALAFYVMDAEGLGGFSGAVRGERIEQFRKAQRRLEELAKEEIYLRLVKRVPDFTREAAQSSELGILQRAIRSGGRGISVRRLFRQIPNLLPRLCPCMLMSPLSAAQYLDTDREPFDLVVFDEASQLPTCKAVGALARGRSAVVVGDPNQMPPTAFFKGDISNGDASEEDDLESILDECLAIGMPQTHLLWHYRSRHESLIAFSNSQFYENRLYTFPSVNDRESRVRLVQTDGFFDRGGSRQNRAEAQAVVEELLRRFRTPGLRKASVGVVTFNISQQNLIDDLFTEACTRDGELEKWAFERTEPLFIKNLENVQGDERDVILFSVGYGSDREGKVSMNFGPLNREGGWRRLNVAVSRAREEMTVFSTITHEQIDLTRTNSRGAAALKAFLAYARNGSIKAASQSLNQREESGLADNICHLLQRSGYRVQQQVGHSAYRIDIGVVDPRDGGRYLAGILLDGPSYRDAKTVRDRELGQESVLKGLGWELIRIWSIDWLDNPRKEADRLLERLDQLKKRSPASAGSDTEGVQTVQDAPEPVEQKNEKPEGPPKTAGQPKPKPLSEENIQLYHGAKLPEIRMSIEEYISPQFENIVSEKIKLVMKTEAPVSESLLMKRVLQSCGIPRGSGRIYTHSMELYRSLGIRITEQEGGRFLWREDQDPDNYSGFRVTGEGANRREARDIPQQEAANGVCAILEEQIGMPKADLLREAVKRFGYMRAGAQALASMERGVEWAVKSGRITVDKADYTRIAEHRTVLEDIKEPF